ncbi:MAG: glyoxalase [Chloroflexi bacterium]|nr:glyoxalase [Chloroflexota bacterium]MBV9600156.1 glyoxalase [Chloroflexota bacterium]
MDLKFISTIAIVTPDPSQSTRLYTDALGLPLEPAAPGDDYVFTEKVDGARHFGVWPLAQAAQACFGTSQWPSNRPLPQLSIEFDVPTQSAVAPAAEELSNKGYDLLHAARTEPWGQTVARFQTPEGVILGISYVPAMHEAR